MTNVLATARRLRRIVRLPRPKLDVRGAVEVVGFGGVSLAAWMVNDAFGVLVGSLSLLYLATFGGRG